MAEANNTGTPTKAKTENTCIMDCSSYTTLEARGRIKNFAIKYVVSGTENYKVNGFDFKVAAGQYLLAGFNSEASVYIDSKTPVTGICVDLSKDILNDVLSFLQTPGTTPEHDNLWRLMSSSDFPENKYRANATQLGKALLNLQFQFASDETQYIDPGKETYFRIAESVVGDCLAHLPIYQRIKTVKLSTRKEIFRKLLRARAYMDHVYPLQTEVAEIAQHNGFSEYHFFRLFKNAFQISPYQYLLNKRLLHASKLLGEGGMSVSEVAFTCGFGDVHNFSKSFKKKFGRSPSWFSVHPNSRI